MLKAAFFKEGNESKRFFRGCGSFGQINGDVSRNENEIFYETDKYRINCEYQCDDYGVFTRNDTFTNKSNEDISVNCLKSRFVFEGGEYQVYTQFNHWLTESMGGWQPLVTSVSASGGSVRTTHNATPFIALWNEQTQRGVAFHIKPNCAWEMKVTKAGHNNMYTKVVVELGMLDYNLGLKVSPDETVNMPEIICYEFKNKIDMDCYKLHNYMHTHYPRRQLPIIYDTWMYRFDHITYENVSSQIKLAKELGVEYFFIDAGWFGKGADWYLSIGDWSENTTSALKGRMIDIANQVREAGMKFGIWLEPGRAFRESDAVKNHPDYYILGDVNSSYFFDYANDEAREWMLNIIFDLVEKYGIEYIKDDFNGDMYFDAHNSAFLKYHEGHMKFVKAIKDRYPDLYLSSCASGGQRMELQNYTEYDSSWPSDNESPYDEMEIYKETILRLPPQAMERWVAVHSLMEYEEFYAPFASTNDNITERMIACGDATWRNLSGVKHSFMDGYMTCGPIGFSCDLTRISPKAFEHFREFVAKVKENREFWKTAVARILCDTPAITAYEYSDMSLSKIVVQLFTHKTQQTVFKLYPVVDINKTYSVNGEIRTGADILENGIELISRDDMENWNEMLQMNLDEVL